jgi:hypothetical protein
LRVKTFLVFEPANGSRDADGADRVTFVREKFYWSALFFAPLWLLWHRLWLGFTLWLVAEILLTVGAYAFDLDPRAAAVVGLLPSLIVAFEGSELRRRKLLRKRFREVAVVVGRDREDAERRFFLEWADAPPRSPSPPETRAAVPPPAPPSTPPVSVIGLFPEPGAGR